MVEKKEKAEPKEKAAKKVAAPKAEVKVKKEAAAPKKEATAVAPAAPKKEKAAPSGKTLTLVQIGSPIGRQQYQRATLIGLGLNKIRRTSIVPDTAATRGMIEKVKHLVKVVQ